VEVVLTILVDLVMVRLLGDFSDWFTFWNNRAEFCIGIVERVERS
jgi:hypothetical protein